MIYLVIFTGLLHASYRRIWCKVAQPLRYRSLNWRRFSFAELPLGRGTIDGNAYPGLAPPPRRDWQSMWAWRASAAMLFASGSDDGGTQR